MPDTKFSNAKQDDLPRERMPANGQAALECERLIALHAEARAADPVRGALSTRAILVADLKDILAAGRFDLLQILYAWASELPASCRICAARLNKLADVGGFSITNAAVAIPRFAMVAGFCHKCAAQGHESMCAAAVSAPATGEVRNRSSLPGTE